MNVLKEQKEESGTEKKKKKKKKLFELKTIMSNSRADQKFFSRTVFPLRITDSMNLNDPGHTSVPLKFLCLLGFF